LIIIDYHIPLYPIKNTILISMETKPPSNDENLTPPGVIPFSFTGDPDRVRLGTIDKAKLMSHLVHQGSLLLKSCAGVIWFENLRFLREKHGGPGVRYMISTERRLKM
jgi:hypothetical protein